MKMTRKRILDANGEVITISNITKFILLQKIVKKEKIRSFKDSNTDKYGI